MNLHLQELQHRTRRTFLFVLYPDLSDIDVLGIPVPWVVLGFLVYPALIGGGWVYVRLTERIERDFAEFVERS